MTAVKTTATTGAHGIIIAAVRTHAIPAAIHAAVHLQAAAPGAGFGGCMIALVDKNKLNGMLERVNESYYNLTGLKADFYIARVGSKARKVCL